MSFDVPIEVIGCALSVLETFCAWCCGTAGYEQYQDSCAGAKPDPDFLQQVPLPLTACGPLTGIGLDLWRVCATIPSRGRYVNLRSQLYKSRSLQVSEALIHSAVVLERQTPFVPLARQRQRATETYRATDHVPGRMEIIMDREDFLLIVVAAGGVPPLTPVQLQKSLFLINENLRGEIPGPFYKFDPYHYGPFDANVYVDADALEPRGLLVSVGSSQGTWLDRTITPAGMIFSHSARRIQHPSNFTVMANRRCLAKSPGSARLTAAGVW